MTTERTTMNGKPVLRVPVKTVLNLDSLFKEKLLSDGPTLALGEGCAFTCAFCYVPAVYQKLDRIREALEAYNKANGTALRHEDVVILREGGLAILAKQLRHSNGKPKYWDDASDRRVVYASPADDVAANMDLVRATVDACAEILSATHWQIRLLSKSNLLPKVAAMLIDKAKAADVLTAYSERDVYERMIFGFSTGTLDDRLAQAFEEGTPLVSKRINALHVLQDNGFRTFGMVCPSLPREDQNYDAWAESMAAELRPDKLEHVWAEVINLRGDSFKRTNAALVAGGFEKLAVTVDRVSHDAEAWENYNRGTFLAHAKVYDKWVGKLRYLTYVKERSKPWWLRQIARGAVLLGKEAHG